MCFLPIFKKIFWTLFSLGVSVCTHTRQLEHQRCSRTGRVQKNHKIRKKTQYLKNTLYLNLSYMVHYILSERRKINCIYNCGLSSIHSIPYVFLFYMQEYFHNQPHLSHRLSIHTADKKHGSHLLVFSTSAVKATWCSKYKIQVSLWIWNSILLKMHELSFGEKIKGLV